MTFEWEDCGANVQSWRWRPARRRGYHVAEGSDAAYEVLMKNWCGDKSFDPRNDG